MTHFYNRKLLNLLLKITPFTTVSVPPTAKWPSTQIALVNVLLSACTHAGFPIQPEYISPVLMNSTSVVPFFPTHTVVSSSCTFQLTQLRCCCFQFIFFSSPILRIYFPNSFIQNISKLQNTSKTLANILNSIVNHSIFFQVFLIHVFFLLLLLIKVFVNVFLFLEINFSNINMFSKFISYLLCAGTILESFLEGLMSHSLRWATSRTRSKVKTL